MPEEQKKQFEKVCCIACGAFLFREAIFMGAVEIKCPKCNTINTFERVPEFGEEPIVKVQRPKKE
jgi:phage FluMu protein Com